MKSNLKEHLNVDNIKNWGKGCAPIYFGDMSEYLQMGMLYDWGHEEDEGIDSKGECHVDWYLMVKAHKYNQLLEPLSNTFLGTNKVFNLREAYPYTSEQYENCLQGCVLTALLYENIKFPCLYNYLHLYTQPYGQVVAGDYQEHNILESFNNRANDYRRIIFFK